MVWNFRVRALGAAMAFVLAGAADAALTEQQVDEALGSVPGVAWSIDGPDAEAWTVTGSGTEVSVASSLRNESYRLTATVTGPGVLELASSRMNNAFDGGIQVDGVDLTSFNFSGATRVMVGEGTHTVTWKATHWRFNDEPVSATFSGAKWEPYDALPLFLGEADFSVILSGQWLGQARWHHGDGGAVFSGGVNEASQVLSGSFTGPGVLLYQASLRTPVSFALDGGAAETVATTYGEWKREWYPAGSGSHIATWTGGKFTEATIDEVQVVPEVDLAAALDTPGRVWTSTTSGVWRAVGVPMDGTVGGHSVLLDSKVKLSSDFAGQGILRVRYRTGSPEGNLNGSKLSSTTMNSTMEWRTKVILVPAGGGTVTLDSTLDTEIDSVEWEPLPTTVAETLGLPVGTTTTGGEGMLAIVPTTGSGKHMIKTSLTPEVPTAWINSIVTGPARVALSFETSQNGVLDFLLDGVEVWDSQVPANGRVTLEIPAGQHVLRAEARATTATAGSPFTLELREMTVTPVESVGLIAETLGYPAKWTFVGEWEKVEYLTFDGDGSLRPVVPEGTDDGTMTSWLGTTVTGPGYLSFRRKQLLGYPVLTLYGDTIPGGVPMTSAAEDWTVDRHWFPAGTHKVQLKVEGSAWGMYEFHLDDMNFEPSGTGLLSEVSIGTPLVMQDVPSHPWMLVKAPDAPAVLVSPLEETGESRLSTTVTGPGVLKFFWRSQGQNPASRRFLIDGTTDWTFPAEGSRLDTVMIPNGTHQLEWIAGISSNSWLEVSQIDWQPWPESALDGALDSPEGVTWTTGGDAVFKGRPDANAKNGTGAYVELDPGESAWLETTVEGPGVLDFSMLESLVHHTWLWRTGWSVTVDGEEMQWGGGGFAWNPIWVRGEGPHTVRVTFTSGSEYRVSGLVDDLTWVPLVKRPAEEDWVSNVSEAWDGYTGPDGGGWILRTSYFTPSWIEKTVTGPCEVTWESHAVGGEGLVNGEPSLTVDGKAAVVIRREDSPRSNTLIIPAGTHVIRWANLPERSEFSWPLPQEDHQGSYWRISDPVVTPGVSPIAEAIDAPDSCWLVQGGGGEVITGAAAMDGVDAYAAGLDRTFYYLNLADSMQRIRGSFRYNWSPHWVTIRVVLEAGQSMEWRETPAFSIISGRDLDAFTAETLPEIPLDEALDAPLEAEVAGWRGVVSATESYDGTDCAWSFIRESSVYHSMRVTLNKPGTIRFRWKRGDGTSLMLRLNGGLMPMAASTAWEEVTLQVGNGTNVIQWVHHGGHTFLGGEAWVDAVSFVESPSWDLAALGSGAEFSASAAGTSVQWKPVKATMPGGEVVTAARAVNGSSVMSATITGPKILHFRAACFAGEAVPIPSPEEDGRIVPRVDMEVIGGGGGGGGGVSSYELTVRMNGNFYGRTQKSYSVLWDDASVLVPAGMHEVSWQLSAVSGLGVRTPASVADLQGWVTDLRLESFRERFDRWAEDLPAGKRGPGDDADGDGVSNLLEYAFRSSSTDAGSKPPQVSGRIESSGSSYEVLVPYLSLLAEGTLQSSADMVTWQDHPVQWLDSKPATGAHTWTHQSITIPVSPDDKARFFRVKVGVGE